MNGIVIRQQFYMKNQFVKEGLIEARVNKFVNISQKIKEFINQKSINSSTPFYREEDNDTSNHKLQQRAKRSLTDWRQLYIKNNNKIKPQNGNYMSNPDHFKNRCSVTGQCQRTRKVYTTSKANTTLPDRQFFTRQSRRSKNTDSKRQSLIDFALAQNCYEKQILKDEKNLTVKEKKFYNRKRLDSNNIDFMKVGQYLSHISEFRQQELKQLNATQKYINSIKEFQMVRMAPYNLVKIKQKSKIDNARYLQPSRIQHSQNGLRFYERG